MQSGTAILPISWSGTHEGDFIGDAQVQTVFGMRDRKIPRRDAGEPPDPFQVIPGLLTAKLHHFGHGKDQGVLTFQAKQTGGALQAEPDLVQEDRLGHVIVGPVGQCVDEGFPVDHLAQDDDVDISPVFAPDPGNQIKPAHPGHQKVGDDDADFVVAGQFFQCLNTVFGFFHGISVAFEPGAKQDTHHGVVVNDQYLVKFVWLHQVSTGFSDSRRQKGSVHFPPGNRPASIDRCRSARLMHI